MLNSLICRFVPKSLWYLKYFNAVKKLDINEKCLIISFDCDTPEDAFSAVQIALYLRKHKINAVFAVPGETLLENTKKYQAVAKMGFEFINHGFLKHATYVDARKRYESVTWYKNMSYDDIYADIKKGHETLIRVLGVTPKGFRAPHFGTLQNTKTLETIYKTLNDLKYSFSSNTLPYFGLKNGPIFKVYEDIYEFPVSGCVDSPCAIFDSWGYFAAPDRKYLPTDYFSKFKKTIDFFAAKKAGCILNFYLDPSHLNNNMEDFYNCLKYALQRGFKFSAYKDLCVE